MNRGAISKGAYNWNRKSALDKPEQAKLGKVNVPKRPETQSVHK